MPHINLPEGLPGITSALAFRPETAKPLLALAEELLRGPNSLTSGEREMIATFVSARNDCYFCQTSHRAAAAYLLGGNYELVGCRCPRRLSKRGAEPQAESPADDRGQGARERQKRDHRRRCGGAQRRRNGPRNPRYGFDRGGFLHV